MARMLLPIAVVGGVACIVLGAAVLSSRATFSLPLFAAMNFFLFAVWFPSFFLRAPGGAPFHWFPVGSPLWSRLLAAVGAVLIAAFVFGAFGSGLANDFGTPSIGKAPIAIGAFALLPVPRIAVAARARRAV